MKYIKSKTNLLLALMVLSFFLSGTLGLNTNAAPAEIGKTDATGLELYLWVDESIVYVNTPVNINFDIYNNETFTVYTNVTLIIDSVVNNIEYYYMLTNYSMYANSFTHSFTTTGWHNITLEAESSVGFFYLNLDVEVVDYQPDIFVLDVYQDFNAQPGEEVWMDLTVDSHFGHSMNIDIIVSAEWFDVNGTHRDTFNITVINSYWMDIQATEYFYINHTFWNEGHYEIYFFVIDDMYNVWSEQCYWDIFSAPEGGFELYIYQDYAAQPEEEVLMDLEITSKFGHSMFIDIEVFADYYDPNGTYVNSFYVYTDYNFWINNQTTEHVNINYTFWDEGRYDLEFRVIDDISAYWYEYCYWDIYYESTGEGFGLYVSQDYQGLPGEEVFMYLDIYSNFSHSMFIDVEVLAEYYSPNGTYMYDFYIYTSYNNWIDAYSTEYFTINNTFLNEGHYNIYFFVIDDMNVTWSEYCYWDIYYEPLEKFELYVYQDYYAEPGEITFTELEIFSTFHHSMYIDVEVFADYYDPSGTYINSFYVYAIYNNWIIANSSISINFNFTYWSEGTYDLEFRVIDDVGVYWYEYCYWDIYDETPGDLDIWVEQGYKIRVYDTAHMDLFIDSFFDVDIYVNIKVVAKYYDGTTDQYIVIYENIDVFITANTQTLIPIDYIFDMPNHYELEFEVSQQPEDNYWYTYCYWEVLDEDDQFFDLWIDQENFVMYNETTFAHIYVDSYFDHEMYVDIRLDLIRFDEYGTEYRDTYFDNYNVYIEAGGQLYFQVPISVTIAGYYDVELRLVDDVEAEWFAHCWYEFFYPGEGWLMHIDQQYEINVDERADMWISFKSLYPYTKVVDLYLLFEEYDGENFITNYTIWEEYEVEIGPYEEVYFNVDYYFDHPGHYDVYFMLQETDTHNWYDTYCWWNVYEHYPGRVDLWVNQQFDIKVDEEAYMELNIKSNVDYSMPIRIEVLAKLMESGSVVAERIIYYNSEFWLQSYTETVIDIWYTFDLIGHWELEFEVMDDEYNYWYTYCYWDVHKDAPLQSIDIKVDVPAEVLVNTAVSSIAEIFNNHNETVEIFNIRIILEPLEMELYSSYNVSVWLSSLTSKSYTFAFNATDTGFFKIRVEIDSSIGFYSEFFSFEIVDELSTDTETDTDTDTDTEVQFTPGFEYFILPLVAVALTLYRKKK